MMPYEFRSIGSVHIFPRLQSIYKPSKLAESLKQVSNNAESKIFLNFLGVELPKSLKKGNSSSEHKEKMDSISQSITRNPVIDHDGFPVGINYVKEHNELVRTIASTKKPIISIIGGKISQPTLALAGYTPFRIVTEDALVRPVDSSIGLMSGLLYMLSRMADDIEFSRFLIMSSIILEPKSALLSGLATHYVKSENIEQLVHQLCSEKTPNILNTLSMIDSYSTMPQEEHFSSARETNSCFLSDIELYKMIHKIFSSESIEEILENIYAHLKGDIRADVKHILKISAESLSKERRLETIYRLILVEKARSWDLNKCLDVENYFTQKNIRDLILNNPSLKDKSSIAGLIRELKSTFSDSFISKLHQTPHPPTEEVLPSTVYREILGIPTKTDIKKVVTGEIRDSDDYSLEEHELIEWFENNWGFYHGVSTSENEKIHTDTDTYKNLSDNTNTLNSSLLKKNEHSNHPKTSDIKDEIVNEDSEVTVCFKNHYHVPSKIRMMIIIEKVKRTVNTYCEKVGDKCLFLKWKR